jgi:hypothetical protein
VLTDNLSLRIRQAAGGPGDSDRRPHLQFIVLSESSDLYAILFDAFGNAVALGFTVSIEARRAWARAAKLFIPFSVANFVVGLS